MLTPTRGAIFVEGTRVDALADATRARIRSNVFGFVFQDAALDPTRTVLDNVTEVMVYRGEDPRQAERRARDLLDAFGVEVPLGRRPGQVSGGQAQRIALCRALIGLPRIVLADEPTGNLDPASAQIVVDALHRHAHDGGVVAVVTHTPAVARLCDREILL